MILIAVLLLKEMESIFRRVRKIANTVYSQTSVHELNSFLKVVRKPKCS